MSSIEETFRQRNQRRAFMPFVTAGDPNLAFTERLLIELDQNGCDLIELGIPYSDPIADGPVIQESYTRALSGGVKLASIFEMLGRVTPKIQAPIVTMVSYSIVHRVGVNSYLQRAKQVGVAGLIVPDLPADESESLAAKCGEQGLSLIQLVTPTTHPERVRQIMDRSTGFIYYVSVAGITGERNVLPAELEASIAKLRAETSLPICIGFGISQPEHIERLKHVADGFIVGSAIVKRIATASSGSPEETVIADVVQYAKSMLAAAKHTDDL